MMNSRILAPFLVGALLMAISCQSPKEDEMSIEYPETYKDTSVVDDYFGTLVADPFRWLEDDLSAETAEWIKQQNKVTFGYLERIPYREQIRQRLEKL